MAMEEKNLLIKNWTYLTEKKTFLWRQFLLVVKFLLDWEIPFETGMEM